MITIEGLGGKGTLWCTFPLSPIMSNTDGMIGQVYPMVYGNAPSECYIPPVGDPSIWHDTTTSPYGFRVSKLDIGTLVSVSKSPLTPNPCEHSTITGGLMFINPAPTQRLSFLKPAVFAPRGYTWYTPDGVVAQFFQGYALDPAPVPILAYNRKGELKPYTLKGGLSSTLGFTGHSFFTDWCDASSSPTPFYSNGANSSGFLQSRPSDPGWINGTTLFTSRCTHVSANVWEEVLINEFHQNGSYIPSLPVSKETGFGYVASFTKRTRVHTMTHIQNLDGGLFVGRFKVTEVCEYWGHMPAWPKAIFYSGVLQKEHVFDTAILVLYPGVSVGGSLLKSSLDDYCQKAVPRAKMLYRCNSATIARSNAVADVSALDSNWIENLSQIGGTSNVILPLLLGWKAVKKGDILTAWRALCGAYLSYKYVIAPGISDYKDVKANIGTLSKGFTKYRFSNERRRGKFITNTPVLETSAILSYFCTINLQLKDSSFAAVFNALERLGLDPSSGNIWDLIPFSFVVDWFFHIGPTLDKLNAYDNAVILRTVKSRIETFKVQWPLTLDDVDGFSIGNSFSVVKPLHYSWYDRRILSGIGSFDPFSGQSNDGLTVSQMTQGGALLSSYRR